MSCEGCESRERTIVSRRPVSFRELIFRRHLANPNLIGDNENLRRLRCLRCSSMGISLRVWHVVVGSHVLCHASASVVKRDFSREKKLSFGCLRKASWTLADLEAVGIFSVYVSFRPLVVKKEPRIERFYRIMVELVH